MSNINLLHEQLSTESCSTLIPSDDLKTNGDMCNFLPNNNICEDIVSSNSARFDTDIDTECDTPQTTTESSEKSPGMEGAKDDTEEDSLDGKLDQEADSQDDSEDPYNINNDKSFDDDDVSYEPTEYRNGVIKKSNKKKKLSSGPGRGRPRKALVTMYQSQISGDKNAIKIRIKKSNFCTQMPPSKKKSGRRKKHKVNSDTDVSDYEKRPKRSKPWSTENDVSSTQEHEPIEQSVWGDPEKLPTAVLERIFDHVVNQEGCLPSLVKFSKVCKLWRDVSVESKLWHKADLNFVKERFRTDLRLHWLILNRLMDCQDLNMGEWKIRDIQAFLEALCEHCSKLKGLNLSGWKGISPDHLKYISTECKSLERLDLSSINFTSPINAQPLVNLSQSMAGRLTHLVLAHNKIANFTQIMAAIATNCPNLHLLDISNIRTFAHNMSLLHIEKLQIGCPNLRVLRITNSQIWLAAASLTEQVASPGFPRLEELSLAGLEEDQTTTSRSVDDDCIERLLKNSTKLRLLDVRGCSKLTDSGLVRVPAWDLEHLFLSACYITRLQNSGLELIVQKWSHSLVEVDLAWSTATNPLDAAVLALAEKGSESKIRFLNLCGSSVSLEPVKAVLEKCPRLYSINLQSCRALPRGIKRLYTGSQVDELRKSLQDKPKTEAIESETDQSPAQTTVSPRNE
ncbi:F-box/LRR-repeat protein 6 [Diabrotica virgifera virgifera]|uniref:F-box domain-containing protein n=1 Tax=Diabrotica virgifera virgifera TaxID=50390 RepID=A0ABM5IHQ5_DIAVI|nr:F-box/LRR-repeat protein 6 [Diabrotica virgifera virgifera]